MDCQRNEVKCNNLYCNILFSVLLSQSFSCDPGSWAVNGMIFLDTVNPRANCEEWQTSNLSQYAFLPPPVHRVLQETPIAETT